MSNILDELVEALLDENDSSMFDEDGPTIDWSGTLTATLQTDVYSGLVE